MKNKFLSAAVVVLLVTMTSFLFAGGYQVNEHGARAMGMGGAFVAQASDASAVFFNPAGLAFQKGFNIIAGGTAIMPATSFTSATPTLAEQKMKSQTFFPPNVYLSYNMDDLTFGLGVFAPYGLGTEWESTWSGRHSAVKTDLQAIYINPTVAYRVNDQFSIGVGFSYVTGSATLNRKVRTLASFVPLIPASGAVTLDGTGSGFTFNGGVLYKPSEDLSVGLSYRHVTKIKYEGDAKFTDMNLLAAYFPGGTGSVEIPMPSNLQVGVAYSVSKDLMLELDVQYVVWSAYDKLTITLPTGPATPVPLGFGGQPLQVSSTSVKDWENAILLRVGGEYKMDNLSLRAGFIYDTTPQPDKSVEPMLPDANRIEFTVGAGYMISDMISVDAAYQFISSAERTGTFTDALGTTVLATYTGTYKSTANLFGFNISLHF